MLFGRITFIICQYLAWSNVIFIYNNNYVSGGTWSITLGSTHATISNSGESRELVDIINYCKRFDIKLISITKNAESSLGKAGTVVLELPKQGEACPLGLAPTSSTTATLVLGDILTIGLIERKGFTKEEFNARHPGGKLGSILKRVGDLMHVGQDMPILDENANMQAVLLEMTSKRLEMKNLIAELRKVYKNVDINIMQSAHNVNLDTLIGYKKEGVNYEFLDLYNQRKSQRKENFSNKQDKKE